MRQNILQPAKWKAIWMDWTRKGPSLRQNASQRIM